MFLRERPLCSDSHLWLLMCRRKAFIFLSDIQFIKTYNYRMAALTLFQNHSLHSSLKQFLEKKQMLSTISEPSCVEQIFSDSSYNGAVKQLFSTSRQGGHRSIICYLGGTGPDKVLCNLNHVIFHLKVLKNLQIKRNAEF